MKAVLPNRQREYLRAFPIKLYGVSKMNLRAVPIKLLIVAAGSLATVPIYAHLGDPSAYIRAGQTSYCNHSHNSGTTSIRQARVRLFNRSGQSCLPPIPGVPDSGGCTTYTWREIEVKNTSPSGNADIVTIGWGTVSLFSVAQNFLAVPVGEKRYLTDFWSANGPIGEASCSVTNKL